jgi:2-methylcitrate dehydratase PrpD
MPAEQRMTATPVAPVLARFVTDTAWDAVPEAVRQQARRSLLNFFATAIGSVRDPEIEAAIDVLQMTAGPGQAAIIGRADRMDVMSAAFINAVSSNFYDFDDTHLRTIIHPTAPVAPAALALAEWQGQGGQAVLQAFLIGAEIECRLGNAVSPGHYARGWHITATCGVFGAAAAAAKLCGLTAEQTAHALGIAASQSGSLVENLPNGAKNVGIGNAARNGILAARLAARGYTAAPAAIEGPLGWARAMGDTLDRTELLGDLGERWEIARNTFKPYPCGIVVHAVIDACLDLRAAHALPAEAIRQVTVSGGALLLARTDRAATNERDAKISLQHCAAVALLLGAAGLAEFTAASVARPDIAAFRSKVAAALDPAMPVGAARVSIATTDGRTLAAGVTHARGSLERPMNDGDLEAKLRSLAAGSGCDADGVISGVWGLDRAASVAGLMRAAQPAG